jgi:L-seryl-tRNA(Ser) seleniumtransferase
MKINTSQQKMLRQLPSVDRLLAKANAHPDCEGIPKSVLLKAVRQAIETQRKYIITAIDSIEPADVSADHLLHQAMALASKFQASYLRRVINATGIVIHTNLGRSRLATEAIEQVITVAGRYSNLEFNLDAGHRGSRYSAVEDLLCELTGAQAALAVNNNAGAVLLCLDTLARAKEVIISRGELVEIGGSFRIPDIMAKSGAILKEVGATNRTHVHDYENAIGSDTGLLLKVHTSNYHIEGFSSSVALNEMVALGARHNLPVMEDLGSGNFIDLAALGLQAEPTVQASVAAGVDVITYSGDKLLGGPQAGFIIGKKSFIDHVKRNPLARALRIDKLTLAATEATLRLYRDKPKAINRIPTLRMLTMNRSAVEKRAVQFKRRLEKLNRPELSVALHDSASKAGGGALPLLELPSCCIGIQINGISANTIETALRQYTPPIIGRIENDMFLMDPRTIQNDEFDTIIEAVGMLFKSHTPGDQKRISANP